MPKIAGFVPAIVMVLKTRQVTVHFILCLIRGFTITQSVSGHDGICPMVARQEEGKAGSQNDRGCLFDTTAVQRLGIIKGGDVDLSRSTWNAKRGEVIQASHI